jgi:hypothetical protein
VSPESVFLQRAEMLAAFFYMASHKLRDEYSFKTRKYLTIMVDDFNTALISQCYCDQSSPEQH